MFEPSCGVKRRQLLRPVGRHSRTCLRCDLLQNRGGAAADIRLFVMYEFPEAGNCCCGIRAYLAERDRGTLANIRVLVVQFLDQHGNYVDGRVIVGVEFG